MENFYKRNFGKDMPFRHLAQHIILGLLVFIFFCKFVYSGANLFNLVTFLLATFLIDLDGLLTVLLGSRYPEFRETILKNVKGLKMREALSYATKNHKKIENLSIHRISFYLLFIFVLIFATYYNSVDVAYIFLAFVVHMSFDIIDDLKHLGHLRHWAR